MLPRMFGLVFSTTILFGQGVVSSGYVAPAPVSVAPGQIATFYVSGAIPAGAAGVGAISVTLQQNGASTAVPVQSLRSVSLCPDNFAAAQPSQPSCGSLLAVTVQIPYDVVTYCPLCLRPISATPPLLVISVSGQTTTAIELNPLADQVHVLTQCDVAIGATPQPNFTGLPCAPLVTHASGTLVTASSPANVGEALTAWVFGLGQTNPAADTGQPAAAAAPTAETFYLNFNYSVNALAAKPIAFDPDRVPPKPLYSGLAPGFVGLYQVNFVVPPQPPNGTPRCAAPGSFAPGANTVQSNFTVSIGGQFSFDGAGICVATIIPVD